MASFEIAMGQGIIAPAPVHVTTSTLHTCSFIAGIGKAGVGAFHYPASSFDEVRPDLDAWIRALQPAKVAFVFASSSQAHGFMVNPTGDAKSDTPLKDREQLRAWLDGHFKGMKAEEYYNGIAVASATAQGEFTAGSHGDGGGAGVGIVVNAKPAGVYTDNGGYSLFGHDEDAPKKGGKKGAAAAPSKCCTIL